MRGVDGQSCNSKQATNGVIMRQEESRGTNVPASTTPTLDYRPPAADSLPGATRPARIGAACFALILVVMIAYLYAQSRHSFDGMFAFIPSIAVAFGGIAYCLLVAFGLIHRHTR